MMKPVADLDNVKAEARRRFSRIRGVEGFGIGQTDFGTPSLRVYVLESHGNLPSEVLGVPIHVVVTGRVSARAMAG